MVSDKLTALGHGVLHSQYTTYLTGIIAIVISLLPTVNLIVQTVAGILGLAIVYMRFKYERKNTKE